MKLFCFIFIFLFGNAFAAEYQIKRGDTLSDILYNNIEGRIYGKNHNLAKLIAANPQIKDPDNIEVGKIIYFPDSFRLLSRIDPNTVLYTPIAEYRKPNESNNEMVSGEKEASKKDDTKEIGKILNQSLVIGIRMNYESLSATETTSNQTEISTSDMAYGVFLRWIHKWSEKFKFFIDASFSKYKFNVSSNKTLEESELSKMYAGVGVRYSYNPRHSFEMGLGMGESFLLNSNNSTELKIDKVMIPAISFSGHHILKSFDSGYGLRASWRTGILMPTSNPDFDTQTGYYWNIGGGSYYESDGRIYDISISYGQRSVETDEIKQTNKNIGISGAFGYSF